MRPRHLSLLERLHANSVISDDGCYLWIGRVSPHTAKTRGGYGRMNMRRGGRHVTVFAHRVVWEVLNGPIPEGLTVHHKCACRRCINPEHLELMTLGENSAEAHQRKRAG